MKLTKAQMMVLRLAGTLPSGISKWTLERFGHRSATAEAMVKRGLMEGTPKLWTITPTGTALLAQFERPER